MPIQVRLGFAMAVLAASLLHAQDPVVPVTPATPGAFEKRGVGSGSGTGSVRIEEQERKVPKKTIHISYIAVSPERTWTDTKGRTITASLIAEETGDATAVKGPLTIVKDGKIRFLKKGGAKALTFPLADLSREDRDYVLDLDAANQKAAEERAAAERR